jgi:hypothetical protein
MSNNRRPAPPQIPSTPPQISDALRQRLAAITSQKDNIGGGTSFTLDPMKPNATPGRFSANQSPSISNDNNDNGTSFIQPARPLPGVGARPTRRPILPPSVKNFIKPRNSLNEEESESFDQASMMPTQYARPPALDATLRVSTRRPSPPAHQPDRRIESPKPPMTGRSSMSNSVKSYLTREDSLDFPISYRSRPSISPTPPGLRGPQPPVKDWRLATPARNENLAPTSSTYPSPVLLSPSFGSGGKTKISDADTLPRQAFDELKLRREQFQALSRQNTPVPPTRKQSAGTTTPPRPSVTTPLTATATDESQRTPAINNTIKNINNIINTINDKKNMKDMDVIDDDDDDDDTEVSDDDGGADIASLSDQDVKRGYAIMRDPQKRTTSTTDLQEEMKEMEDYYESEIRALQSKLRAMEQTSMKSPSTEKVDKKVLEKLQSEVDKKTLEVSSLESKLSSMERQYTRRITDLETKLKDTETTATQDQNMLKKRIDELKLETLHHQSSHSISQNELEDRIRRVHEEYLEYMSPEDIDDLRTEHAKELQAVREEVETLQVRLDEVQHQCEKSLQTLSSVKVDLDERKARVVELEKELSSSREQFHIEQEELQERLERDHMKLRRQLLEEKDRLEFDLKDVQEQLAMVEERKKEIIEDLQRDKNTLRATMEDLEHENGALQSANDKIQNELDELKTLIEREQREFEETKERQQETLKKQNEELNELYSVLENLQKENETLRTRRPSLQQDDMEKVLRAPEQEQEAMKYLEDYIAELTFSYNALEAERNELEQKLEKQSLEPQVISNDEELLKFIEVMTEKAEGYRQQVEQLQKDNSQLKQDLDIYTDKYRHDLQRLQEQNQFELQQLQEELQQQREEFQQKMEERNLHRMEMEEKQMKARVPTTEDSAYISTTHTEDMKEETVLMKDKEEHLMKDLDAAVEREERLQQEFNGLMKEFERLSLNYCDFDTERRQLQEQVKELKKQLQQCQERLHEELAKNLGQPSKATDEDSSASNMRKDFRRLLEEIRNEFNDVMDKETDLRIQAEKKLRAMKRERELEVYGRVHESSQTIESYLKRR